MSAPTVARVRTIVFCHDHPDGPAFDPSPALTSERDVAVVLAATYPDRVDRLVLCCVPAPLEAADFDPARIAAKTLLIYGQFDEDAPFAHARWWKNQVSNARVEMVPRRGSDIIDVMWKRVLSHAAPHTPRSRS